MTEGGLTQNFRSSELRDGNVSTQRELDEVGSHGFKTALLEVERKITANH